MAIEQRRMQLPMRRSRLSRRNLISLTLAIMIGTVGIQFVRWSMADNEAFEASAPDVPPAAVAVAAFEARVAANPASFVDFVNLGEAYMRQARETSDVSAYARADEAADRAIAINPDYAPARLLQAGVRLAMHDFAAALELAEPLANSNNPAPALATMFDAQLALGHYADAAISLGALNAEASGPSVQVRRQVLLETQGSYQEAIALAEQALADARVFGLGGEALVWYVVNAAELHLRYGETEMADELFAEAIDLLPAYAPALSGRGEVALAEGDAEEAVAWLNQAAAIAPQPEFLIALLRANESVGRAAEATSVAAQLDAEVQLTLAGNGTSNRLLALYLVDAGLNLGAAQTLAEREAERRADVLTLDTLAWVRLAAGDVAGALESSTAALEVGTQDPLILYHAGVIRAASGDSDGARVLLERCLSLNPAFDALHATRAAALLDELSSSQR